jgi:hypothetical protein
MLTNSSFCGILKEKNITEGIMEFLFFVIPVVVIGLIVLMVARKQKGISKNTAKDSESVSLLRKIERNTFITMIIMVVLALSSVISAIYTVIMMMKFNF